MAILHGTWINRRFHLWAEISPIDISPIASVSPYSATPQILAKIISFLRGKDASSRARHARLISAKLPHSGNTPIPSKVYLAPQNFPIKGDKLAETKVYTLPLSFCETLYLLHYANKENIAKNLIAGKDLIISTELMRLARDIVLGGKLIPTIRNHKSFWLPVPNLAELQAINTLSKILPKAACALDGALSQATYAQNLLEEFADIYMRHIQMTNLSAIRARSGSFDSVHAAWLASLRSRSQEIYAASQNEIDELEKSLNEWSLAARAGINDARVGFKIQDPPEGHIGSWRIIPVIVKDGKALLFSQKNLAKYSHKMRESLLVSLGQAAHIFPQFASAQITLSKDEVAIFMREIAPKLSASGYIIFAPYWWHSKQDIHGKHVRLSLRAVSTSFGQSQGKFSLDSLLDVKWKIVLGNRELEEAEIDEIMRSASDINYVNGRYIYLPKSELENAILRKAELEKSPISARDLTRLALGIQSGIELDFSKIKKSELGKKLTSISAPQKITKSKTPKGFVGKLRDYQLTGLAWLKFVIFSGFGACLADDMGLGKTIEAIAFMLSMREEGATKPFLVVAPMSIMTKWKREIATFAPKFRTYIHHGKNRLHKEKLLEQIHNYDIVVVSYQLLTSDLEDFLMQTWDLVILDEAQNIKNPATHKSIASRRLKAISRLAMTGTPVENGVGDLWSIMEFLNPGLLPSKQVFEETFVKPIRSGAGFSERQKLRRICQPFVLRRVKTDKKIITDLPPRIEEKIYCNLTKEQVSYYIHETQGLTSIPEFGIAHRGCVLALLTKLKQICNHPEQYLGEKSDVSSKRSGKLARLDSVLDEVIARGEASLIFTQYATMGHLLKAHYTKRLGYDIPFLSGEVPLKARDEMISRFQHPDGPQIFILSIKAGGTGLDLTRANHVFHYDRWWNPAVENQATDRAHRIGQKKTVFVHTLVCEGTLEQKIDELLHEKSELASGLIGSGDQWLASLSNGKLREILSLSEQISEEDYA